MFDFQAGYVHTEVGVRRLSFADREDASGEHYFIMDRSEDSQDDAVPNMDNVYIERDDQGMGGYGGIERVVLERDGLILDLGPRMAAKMGGHDRIRIGFALAEPEFSAVRNVLGLIMRGYESRLELRA